MLNINFLVDIVTPQRVLYSGRVTNLIVMAWDGYLGVLANHAPLLEQLGIGELHLTEPDGSKTIFAIGGGFMEVGSERTVVLADSAERPGEIDAERARAAQERAEARISGRLETSEFDVERARIALLRALNRLHISENPSGVTF